MSIEAKVNDLIGGFLGISSQAEKILEKTEFVLVGAGKNEGSVSEEKAAFLTALRNYEARNFAFLLHYQPVACDLRTVSAIIKTLSDIEHIGVQGCDIRQIIQKDALSPEAIGRDGLSLMAQKAREMTSNALDAFARNDKVLAQTVIDSDDIVDREFFTLKERIAQRMTGAKTEATDIDKIMIGKYLERIADHACSVAWRVLSL